MLTINYLYHPIMEETNTKRCTVGKHRNTQNCVLKCSFWKGRYGF